MAKFANLEQVSVYYNEYKALNEINLTIEQGQTCSIIGPSGCGKTTLLYAMAGLLPVNSGKVTIDGELLTGIRDRTSIILQEYGLFPWKTVWDNVALGLVLKKHDDEASKQKIADLLKSLGLYEHRNKYPTQLSGGQKQRIAVARAWITQPDLLLMDEPFSALDTITRENLQNILMQLYREQPITWVLVTHTIEEAVFLGQKIVLMAKNGGTILQVLDNPSFGMADFRENQEFYNQCMQIRKLMKEVYDETE